VIFQCARVIENFLHNFFSQKIQPRFLDFGWAGANSRAISLVPPVDGNSLLSALLLEVFLPLRLELFANRHVIDQDVISNAVFDLNLVKIDLGKCFTS
jgi:hypothetical protein